MQLPEVILVDELDQQQGVMEKLEAHQKGLLHRAFSVFIINDEGKMLLQQRAKDKYHSGGLWTNACCSHPQPGENTLVAAQRRLSEEMGFTCFLQKLEAFKYYAEFENGLIEHEYDHIYLGKFNGKVLPNKDEVSDYQWLGLEEIQVSLEKNKDSYTYWFHLAYPIVKKWLDFEKKYFSQT
ncbi:isopentenyl-diphosphate Delta-isomerase [Pedobacter sp. SYSU D00535]|uniref:isopentenyl-diphosphate Delta-isomerase n=1 Tax=Pedobacter sp. SYSU D00535 TaxID=2810308 RepID=UPI001A96A86C|nr:isopentenyl-diphosphate Delta-isomerase [Pedobacter sp. SYSU D00535]